MHARFLNYSGYFKFRTVLSRSSSTNRPAVACQVWPSVAASCPAVGPSAHRSRADSARGPLPSSRFGTANKGPKIIDWDIWWIVALLFITRMKFLSRSVLYFSLMTKYLIDKIVTIPALFYWCVFYGAAVDCIIAADPSANDSVAHCETCRQSALAILPPLASTGQQQF